MKTSLTKNGNKLKQIIQDLDKLILAKAYELARYIWLYDKSCGKWYGGRNSNDR